MSNHQTSIEIRQCKDLIEIEAHYYSDFTATADADIEALTDFLKAYMYADDKKRPDVSLSIAHDHNTLIKNIKLNELNVFECSKGIKENDVTIVTDLALSALKHAQYNLAEVDEQGSILSLLQKKCERLQSLSNQIQIEHNMEIPSEHHIEADIDLSDNMVEIQ